MDYTDDAAMSMFSDGQVKRMGHDLMRQHHKLFKYWRQYKAGKIKWSTFQGYVAPIREEVRGLLLRGSFSGNAKLTGFFVLRPGCGLVFSPFVENESYCTATATIDLCSTCHIVPFHD